MAVYFAPKAYVVSLSDGLWAELRGSGNKLAVFLTRVLPRRTEASIVNRFNKRR